MPIDLWLAAELAALGICTGFLAGMLGVGGGMMQVPFLTIILSQQGVPAGMAVKMAIATSMATILFTSLSSLRAHHRRGAVRWDLVRGIAPGIVAGGLLAGAGVFALIKGPELAFVFALFISFSAAQMMRDRKPRPTRQMPGLLGQSALGGGIGLLSGLVGAGGAFISVAVHDLVQRADAPGGGHQRGARLPDRIGQHRGLRDQRLGPAQRIARRLRLPLSAGAVDRVDGQRRAWRRWARARRTRWT